MSNTSKRTTDMSEASPDAWLDDLCDQYPQSLKRFKDTSPTAYAGFKTEVAAHLQEREAELRVNELTLLDNSADEITPEHFHEYYIQRMAELLAVGEGRN